MITLDTLREEFREWFDSDKEKWDSYTEEDTIKAREEIFGWFLERTVPKSHIKSVVEGMKYNLNNLSYRSKEGAEGYNEALTDLLYKLGIKE